MKKGYIYKITNKKDQKVYIGQTDNPVRRKAEHLHDAQNRPGNRHLYRAMNKHGINNFSFEVLKEVDYQLMNEEEIKTIKEYDSFNNGYNLTSGGDNNEHKRVYTDEEVIEIRKDKQNKTFNELYKEYGKECFSYGGFKKLVYGESYSYLPTLEELSTGEKSQKLIDKENIEKGKGRRVFTDEEVIQIRTERPKYTLGELYDLYGKDKITPSGFEKVVNNSTYSHLPSLKEIHGDFKIKIVSPKRLLSDDEVITARKAKSREKCSRKELHEKYGHGKISFSAFNKMIYSYSYKDLPSVEELMED